MNNADIFIMPLKAKVVQPKEWEALLERFRVRLEELKAQGWKPSNGWAAEEPSDDSRPA